MTGSSLLNVFSSSPSSNPCCPGLYLSSPAANGRGSAGGLVTPWACHGGPCPGNAVAIDGCGVTVAHRYGANPHRPVDSLRPQHPMCMNDRETTVIGPVKRMPC